MAEIVTAMKLDHVTNVVEVHLQSFQGFFLTFLGRDFLSELYRGVVTDSSGVAFVFIDDNHVAGFVAGTDQPRGFYKRLLARRIWVFVSASIPAIIKKPAILPRLLRALSMPQQADSGEGCGTLMSIAVLPEAQGKGIGQKLVDAFLAEAARRGLKQVNLTTDKQDNNATNQFYQQYGFHLHRVYITPEGRAMNEYVIDV
jgi:ribosomal protein S18 acetylase RimI-like enzyme